MSTDNSVDSSSESRRGVIARYLDGLSGLIGIIIFANVLGVSNLGKYYVLVAVSQVIASPTDGISIYVEHMIGKVKNNDKIPNIISFGLIINTLIPLLFGFILIIIYNNITMVNSYMTEIQLFLVIGMTLSYSLKFTLTSSYSGLGNPSNSIFISSGEGFIQTIIQIVLLLQMGISGLLIGTIIANSSVIIYVLTKSDINIGKPVIDIEYTLKYARWSIITYSITSVYDRLGTIILVLLSTNAAVGIYQATIKIIQSSRFVSDGICRSLMVKFSQNMDDYPINDLNKLGAYSSLVSIPMIFGGLIIGEDLLTTIYTNPEYAMGYYILIGGSIYFAIKAHSIVLNSVLNGSGTPKVSSISLIVATIILLISGILLVYYIGLNGIIISLVLSEIIRLIILIYGFKKYTGSLYKPYKIKYQIISSTMMMVGVYFIHNLNINPELLQLGISLISGFIIYSVLMILLDSDIRSYIDRII